MELGELLSLVSAGAAEVGVGDVDENDEQESGEEY